MMTSSSSCLSRWTSSGSENGSENESACFFFGPCPSCPDLCPSYLFGPYPYPCRGLCHDLYLSYLDLFPCWCHWPKPRQAGLPQSSYQENPLRQILSSQSH